MTCSGTNGIQAWDTAFSIQAAVEAGLAGRFRRTLQNALDFLDVSQLRDNLEDPYRQQRTGGWPFSTKSNGYIVTDYSVESLKAVLMLQQEWQVIFGYPSSLSVTIAVGMLSSSPTNDYTNA
jgi:lanosterol synthase